MKSNDSPPTVAALLGVWIRQLKDDMRIRLAEALYAGLERSPRNTRGVARIVAAGRVKIKEDES